MSSLETAAPPPDSRGIINSAAYESGTRVQNVTLDQIRTVLARPNCFVWLGLFEPDEALLRRVQLEFGLHDLAVEDAFNAHQRPKLEQYQDSLFVVLRTANLAGTPATLEFGETHVFLGQNYVVTVRHGSLRSHVGLRARCECNPRLLSKGPGYVLYALMDFVVDQYFPIVEAIENVLEDIEEEIFAQTMNSETTARIYRLKRDLLSLKRAIAPLVEVCNRLVRFDVDLVPGDTRVYFRDVYDHVLRLNEMIDNQRELLSAALEANLSLISVAQNEHMKRLAAWAAIIAVPTMIAGIYGMNFTNMPELGWRYGYVVTLALMALACGGLFVGFRRSGWL